MAYKTGNRVQPTFLPPVIEDYVGLEDPVRVYDAFVDALDFKALGIPTEPSSGADEYYPKDLVKLIIYGYSYGIRSSRKSERACHHNLSFQWLMGGQKPDYRTIARFRSKYKQQIRKLLKQCVRICMDLNLIEGNTLFTDGSKFRANASINQTWTKEKCEKNLRKIYEHIDRLLEESEKIDKNEDEQNSMVKLNEQVQNKKKLVEKIQGIMGQLKDSDKEYINSTDPDCVKAKGRQGSHACYNVQMTVDNKHGLIVHGEGISENNDLNQLKDQLEKSTDTVGKKPENSCADAGYNSTDDLAHIDKDIRLIVPSKEQSQEEKGQQKLKPFDKEQFTYDREADEYICPEGKRLKCQGLNHKNQSKQYRASARDCRNCQRFEVCTSAKTGRTISRLLQEGFRQQLKDTYDSPEGQQIYQLRKEKVEHPFGHFKRNLAAGQFMLRGKDKVDAEVSILSTCFNIARMITIIGIPELIARLHGS